MTNETKVKEKTAKNKCGFDEIDKHLVTNLQFANVKKVYKLFGVQSRVGEIGIHASLKNWRGDQPHVGSKCLTRFPHPAHFPNYN